MNSHSHLIIPILVPFFTALVLTLVGNRMKLQKGLSLLSSLSVAAYVFWLLYHVDQVGILTMSVGGWDAPYGIVFVADRLAAIMLCLSMGVGSVAMLYTFWTVTKTQQQYFFYPLMQVLFAGVNWAFLTGDLFNLFVAYEVMLIGSYGMMMVGASKPQVRQTLKYIAINAVGSTLFVTGVGLIYALIGTLNFADIARITAAMTAENGQASRAAMVTAASVAIMVVFALKTAAFPLFFWLPDSYPIVPAGINGYYAGLLTKVGVYSLLRVFVMVFQQDGHELAANALLVMSGFTMLLGVLGAMCQWDIRRILSWHIISQVGYMVMGIGLTGSTDPRVVNMAIAGTIFYIVHHIIVKSCLFLVGGIAERVSGTQELKKMGGVLDIAPGVAGLFLVAALSLAGVPPFSGFLSKFVLVSAGLEGKYYVIVAVSILTSFFTLYSMAKIWSYAFWRTPSVERARANYRGMMAPTGVLVAATIVIGLFAQPFIVVATKAADDVRDPANYVKAVLGPDAWPVVPLEQPALATSLPDSAAQTAAVNVNIIGEQR